MRLPDWLIVGAAKSGTTALHAMASQHPGISVGRVKEPRYFATRYEEMDAQWYAEIFATCPPDTLALDASVDNTLASQPTNPAVDRIAELLPDARLVYIARDPVDRIASNVRMLEREGLFGAPGFPADDDGRWEIVRHDSRLLDRSRYWWHVTELRRRFSDDAILPLVHEDLERDPDRVLQQVYAFLGLEPHGLGDVIRTQVAEGPRRAATNVLGAAVVERIEAELLTDARRYLRYADRPASTWRLTAR